MIINDFTSKGNINKKYIYALYIFHFNYFGVTKKEKLGAESKFSEFCENEIMVQVSSIIKKKKNCKKKLVTLPL